jgi:hypothetical protein
MTGANLPAWAMKRSLTCSPRAKSSWRSAACRQISSWRPRTPTTTTRSRRSGRSASDTFRTATACAPTGAGGSIHPMPDGRAETDSLRAPDRLPASEHDARRDVRVP